MNLCVNQKQTHRQREQTCGCESGGGVKEGWVGGLGLAIQASMYRADKQQGPTVSHRELYSTSSDKP